MFPVLETLFFFVKRKLWIFKLIIVGVLIRDGRIRRGMTQEELGMKVGVGRAQISKIENGKGLTIKTGRNVRHISMEEKLLLLPLSLMKLPPLLIPVFLSNVSMSPMKEATGLYIESSAYVYEILKSEMKMGKIR